jgi:4-hydroxy-tetrahydrodipicolinate reductase
MIRVAIAGAAGRMGQTLVHAVSLDSAVQLVHAFEQTGSPSIGADVGEVAGIGHTGILLTDTIDSADFDLLIDFTIPNATIDHLEFCRTYGRRIVIGTTGLDQNQRTQIAAAAAEVGVVLAPNMSIGVNLSLKLIELAARTFGDSVDVEVIEAHHRHKVDAPSGTALRMGEVAANALGRNLDSDGVFTRYGQVGARDPKAIGFTAIRAGEIVGEHTVLFATAGERVEITHKASSREIYATGALRAAIWLMDRPAGLYDMQQVLDLYD